MATVLLFGNAYQGVLMETRTPGKPLVVAVPPRPDLISSLYTSSVPTYITYEPRRFSIFGVVLDLHVETDLADERLEAMMADHLLSDKAKAVGGRW